MNPSKLFSHSEESRDAKPRAPRAYFSRLASAWPLVLLLAFLIFLWSLFGDRFQASRTVELVSVVTQRASPGSPVLSEADGSKEADFEAATLFQASGWIEADPLPIRVTALYSGIIEAVHVLEGDAVRAGQLLATMVDDDARLDMETAQATLAEMEASLRHQLAAAESTRASLLTLELQIETAKGRLNELLDEADRLEGVGKGALPEREVVQARLRADTQQIAVKALQAQEAEINAELKAREAMVAQSRHAVTKAQTDYARKKLALERTQIRSSVDGVIQQLYVAPGIKRMIEMDDLDSATVAKLYQPESLQARIDVPLEEAAALFVGQAVRLRSSLFPNREFHGRVTRLDGQADLQRNTLQAKVALIAPDSKLRPEMLCRAEFLAPGVASGPRDSVASDRVAIYVPEAALLNDGAVDSVWMLDDSGAGVVRQSLELGEERRDGYVRVRAGLQPGDRVVVDPPADLGPGQRIRSMQNN